MKNLGAKLKAAREARELSLKDVHEATKLRVDMLENLENGIFDDKLAEIYRGGFLRIYASFLKFDEREIMREYKTAMAMVHSDGYRPSVSIIPSEEEIPQATNFGDSSEEQSQEIDMTSKYIKLGGIFVLAILVIVVFSMIFSSLMKSEDVPQPEVTQGTSNPVATSKESVNEVTSEKPILQIYAYSDTYLTVLKASDNSVVFTGNIKADTNKDFDLSEALMVRVTQAEKIKISRNSKIVYDKTRSGVCNFNVSPR
jgi:cytoskeletal protein RodZ